MTNKVYDSILIKTMEVLPCLLFRGEIFLLKNHTNGYIIKRITNPAPVGVLNVGILY